MNLNDAIELDDDLVSNIQPQITNDNSFSIGEIMNQHSTNGVFDVIEAGSGSLNRSHMMSQAAENSSRHLAGVFIAQKTPAYDIFIFASYAQFEIFFSVIQFSLTFILNFVSLSV